MITVDKLAFDLVAQTLEVVQNPASGFSGRVSAYVFDTELRPNLEILIIARSNLGTDIHRFSPLPCKSSYDIA